LKSIAERKMKFLEMLLTLGSLLAVFLGFVVEKTGVLLNDLVGLGVLFTVSALASYAATLFPDSVPGKKAKAGVWAAGAFMAVSLGGLVSLGATYFLGLSISGNTLTTSQYAIVVVIIIGSLLGVAALIGKVMGIEDPHP